MIHVNKGFRGFHSDLLASLATHISPSQGYNSEDDFPTPSPPFDASFSQDALAEAEAKRVTWP